MGQQLQKIGHVVSIDINLLRSFGAMLVGGHRHVPHGKFWAWFIPYIKGNHIDNLPLMWEVKAGFRLTLLYI